MVAALEGNIVLELTRVGPGAFTTRMLADMGAEVIKIDTPPGAGPVSGSSTLPGPQEIRSAVFNHLNRNKRSIAINLRDAAGQHILQQLASKADMLVEGFRPGVTKRLGADYDTLKKLNPRLIYCSLSGYGQDGPYRDMPGHDINYLSFGGVLELIGEEGRPPAIPLNLVADYAAATLHGVIGLLMALAAREKTGRGQLVDISYLDGTISLLLAVGSVREYFEKGTVPRRGYGTYSSDYPYYASYETKDGKLITLGCSEPWFWERVCRALGREDLIPLARAPEHVNKKPDEKTTEAMNWLRGVFKTRTRDEWFDFLRQHDVCVGKVYSVDEVCTDPQVLHRQMIVEFDDPRVGKVKTPGIPIKLSETPGRIRSLSPYLGEHTNQILSELGYTSEATAQLREKGVVA